MERELHTIILKHPIICRPTYNIGSDSLICHWIHLYYILYGVLCITFVYIVTAIGFPKMLKPQTAKEGSSVTFCCTVKPVDFPVKWMVGDTPIWQRTCKDRFSLFSDGAKRSLTIRPCNVQDAGIITVKLGRLESTALLTIKGNFYDYCLKRTLG